jgi:DegV family protein with EDD domain
MPDNRVAIVVDSAASLPAVLSQKPGLHVVPMQLHIDGKTYLDGRDINPTDFYRMLKESSVIPTTSAPSPASFLEAFHDASKEADAVLCLTVASRFSASANAANIAVREAGESLHNLEIRVMDTGSAAGAEGLIALEALRAAQRGCNLDEVQMAAANVASKVRLLAFVDTLYYLWKGGRVPRIAHAGTSLLRIKPLFELFQGEVNTIAKPRTTKRAIDKLIELMRKRVDANKLHATVIHADAPELAHEIMSRIESDWHCEELFTSEFTPVMGAHIGPGLLGVAFWSE